MDCTRCIPTGPRSVVLVLSGCIILLIHRLVHYSHVGHVEFSYVLGVGTCVGIF